MGFGGAQFRLHLLRARDVDKGNDDSVNTVFLGAIGRDPDIETATMAGADRSLGRDGFVL